MSWSRIALIAALALCTSCTSAVDGHAGPDSAAPKIPPRPQELRIEDVDPCTALNSDQVNTLRVQYHSRSAPLPPRGPGCDWIHSPYEPIEAYTVAINTDGGIELAFGQSQLTVIDVAGFGAAEVPALYGTGQNDCVVFIDVATRQALQVGYFYNGVTVPMTHEIACAKARNAAELAMRTVLTTRQR